MQTDLQVDSTLVDGYDATVDEEWSTYLNMCDNTDFSDDFISTPLNTTVEMHQQYQQSDLNDATEEKKSSQSSIISRDENNLNINAPISSDIHISTKTVIVHLNQPIDIRDIFWKMPIMPFHTPASGIVKKQIKLDLENDEELTSIQNQLHTLNYDVWTMDRVIRKKNTSEFNGKVKINIGLSKKDLLSYSAKRSGAFLNCVVLIYRLQLETSFCEAHVKIFNTGKIEIPGIQSDKMLDGVLTDVQKLLSEHIPNLHYSDMPHTIVLINSNFTCGYFINRDKLNKLLKSKYNIHTVYNPWYPGIQCKFYYDSKDDIQNGSSHTMSSDPTQNQNPADEHLRKKYKISFMIFRTGSILIVGKCEEYVIHAVHDFLKQLLNREYEAVQQHSSWRGKIALYPALCIKKPKKNPRKKVINVSIDRFASHYKLKAMCSNAV